MRACLSRKCGINGAKLLTNLQKLLSEHAVKWEKAADFSEKRTGLKIHNKISICLVSMLSGILKKQEIEVLMLRILNDSFNPADMREALLDVDGTLYPDNDPQYLQECKRQFTAAAQQESGKLVLLSYAYWRLVDAVSSYGLHKGSALPKSAKNFVSALERARKNLSPDFVRDNPALVTAVGKLAKDAPDFAIHIATHSEKPWVDAVLARVGIAERISSDRIYTPATRIGGLFRFDKREAAIFSGLYKEKLLFSAPDQTVLIDDSVTNLRAAKQAGLRTAWIQARTGTEPQPEVMDIVAESPAEVLELIHQAKIGRKRAEPS